MNQKTDSLLGWRKEFPILKTSNYLISNSLGAMPRSVVKRMNEYTETWASRGVRAWADEWWEMPVSVGNTIAPLIGAKQEEVSMHNNISLLQAMMISCFYFSKKKRTVILSDLEFPSVLYVYQQFATSLGAKLKMIRSPDGITLPTPLMLDAIDEETLLVPLSHVLFKSAYIQNVKAIVEKAHRCGAKVILDAYHSVGVLPVDVYDLGVDVFVGGVLKWLCGGPGGAFLWVHPGLRNKLQPKITGWLAHQHPFAFETSMKFRTDAFRFLNGTPTIPTLYAASEGPKIINKIGIENIRKKSIRQTSLLIERAQECGFKVKSPLAPGERAGTVTINVPHAYQVSQELLRRNIIIDFREGVGIRIAPHFYTSDEEVVNAVEEIKTILDTKAYRKHPKKYAIVT
jgi:kynureninase